MSALLLLLCSYFSMLITISKCAGGLKLQILHVNDIHSRFEETSRQSGVCRRSSSNNSSCYGGFARIKSAADNARKLAQQQGYQSIFLNAGDNFQGTPYYTLFKWKIVAPFVEALSFDAMTLGNHEFDDGVPGVVEYIKNVSTPIVVCNINVTVEPRMRLNNLRRSVILTRGGVRIGVLGYLTPETKALATINEDMIMDELSSVADESRQLKQQNCSIIICLGHSGFVIDKLIAQQIPDIDVIVGGHSHTFLYTGKPPDIEVAQGDYPTVVRQTSGKLVPIVHAYAYSKYLGNIMLEFTENGNLITYKGNPILLDASIEEDKNIIEMLDTWKRGLHNMTQEHIGKTLVELDGFSCRLKECNLGNLATDAFVYVNAKEHSGPGWTDAPVAMLQGGGIRSTVYDETSEGNLTVGEIMTAFPFENIVLKVEMRGSVMWNVLERSVARYNRNGIQPRGEFLQVSGGTISDAVIQYIKDVRVVCPEVNGRIYFVTSNAGCNSYHQPIAAAHIIFILFILYVLLY